MISGALVAVLVESSAVHVAHRRTYSPGMPLLPVLNVGVVPLLQMLLLPPIVFTLAGVCRQRLRAARDKRDR